MTLNELLTPEILEIVNAGMTIYSERELRRFCRDGLPQIATTVIELCYVTGITGGNVPYTNRRNDIFLLKLAEIPIQERVLKSKQMCDDYFN